MPIWLKKKENMAAILATLLIAALLLLPSAFEISMYKNAVKAKARVISVDNDQARRSIPSAVRWKWTKFCAWAIRCSW